MAQLHEHQAKKLLAEYGVAIPRGEAVTATEQAGKIATAIGGEVVVKAQIHSTSRAAAGGIRFAANAQTASTVAAAMLGHDIAGNIVDSVIVEEKLSIEREFYFGYIIDDRLKRPTLLFSAHGGSGIEQRASSMKSLVCSVIETPTAAEIESGLIGAVEPEGLGPKLAEIARDLFLVAASCEARTAEINPLALLSDGKLVAADARISVDDYAVFRHPELRIEMARELGHSPTNLERVAWEIERDDFRGTFYFVEILGDNADEKIRIGFHGAGGGGSMASLDAAQRNGLHPVCYVDTSGNPPASKVYRAARIILSMPGIRGYFLSGSGVASQEQFGLARAVLKAFLEVRPNIPAVLRLGGNGEDIAKEMVERYSSRLPARIEAYRKRDSADFCADRLFALIEDHERRNVANSNTKDLQKETLSTPVSDASYSFKTRTGTVSFDNSKLNAESSQRIVDSCPQKILTLNENSLPILAIPAEEAERGKCSECLACEFASLDVGLGAVSISFPIPGLVD